MHEASGTMTKPADEHAIAPALPFPLIHRGKVRDIYDAGPNALLLVSTDRISAYDAKLGSVVPNRGRILTQISCFWMRTLGHIIPSHLLDSSDIEIPEWAQGRTVHARRLNMVPVEAVVRGYLTGSSWQEYQQTGYVYGHKLEPGMLEASKLASPLFTPTTKSIKHDEPLRTWDAYVRHLGGDERLACRIKDVAVRLFEEASRLAEDKGIIIADTKFEFGIADSGELVLADEVLTPDSSRFWLKKDHRPGTPSQSLDKQYIRDFLTSNGLKGKSGAVLPDHVIRSTVERYTFVLETLTGRKSEFR